MYPSEKKKKEIYITTSEKQTQETEEIGYKINVHLTKGHKTLLKEIKCISGETYHVHGSEELILLIRQNTPN
jgi:hypothetical protein